MPASTPAVAGPVLPPISNDALVDQRGFLTPLGLNLFQQLWAGVFGTSGVAGLAPKPGDMKPIAGASAQSGWLLCDGAAYSDSLFHDLFLEIGTTWGTAGTGTFRVPDLRGKFPIGADGAHLLGTSGGALSRTIAKANLPAYALTVTDPGHVHAVTDPGHAHGITDPQHHHTGGSTATTTNTAGAAAGTSTAANTGDAATGITVNANVTGVAVDSHTTGIGVNSGGSGTALDTTPTYAAVNWLIKT